MFFHFKGICSTLDLWIGESVVSFFFHVTKRLNMFRAWVGNLKQRVPNTSKSSNLKGETQHYVVKLPKVGYAKQYCPKILQVPGTLGTHANSSPDIPPLSENVRNFVLNHVLQTLDIQNKFRQAAQGAWKLSHLDYPRLIKRDSVYINTWKHVFRFSGSCTTKYKVHEKFQTSLNLQSKVHKNEVK